MAVRAAPSLARSAAFAPGPLPKAVSPRTARGVGLCYRRSVRWWALPRREESVTCCPSPAVACREPSLGVPRTERLWTLKRVPITPRREIYPASGNPIAKMAAHGAMTISIDVEPAWAHRPIPRRIIDGLPLERAIVNRLVDLFARYDIRATWAIVGRWLLDTTGCQDAGLLPAVENAPKRPGSEEGDADRHDYDAAPLRGTEILTELGSSIGARFESASTASAATVGRLMTRIPVQVRSYGQQGRCYDGAICGACTARSPSAGTTSLAAPGPACA